MEVLTYDCCCRYAPRGIQMSNAFLKNSLKVSKVMPLLLGLLLLFTFFTAVGPLNSVSAQTQYVAATPG